MNFDAAFKILTTHAPLPWQTRLYSELAQGRIPSALDLPTGLGKTSVIPAWLVARAAGGALPRRLVYVVDRRAVVDQATEVAQAIAKALGDGTDANEAVRDLRAGLGLDVGKVLPVSTLRGQYADNRRWLESPTAPAIVVGTIDMIGSRVLFQGYGVSPRMRAVHAALLGADTLLVLDEAHLVPPFEHLLRAVAAWPRSPGIPPMRLLTLSATGRTEGDAPFRLTPEDRRDPRTAARLQATKRVAISDAGRDLAETMAQRALDLGGSASRVIVFCDSRRVAQKVADKLGTLARAKFGKDVPSPALLVGGRRVWERAQLACDQVFNRFQPKSGGTAAGPPSTPIFLVATSAGEVGVDLDADQLVMDLVPWERMVQRLGRVNRRAEPGESLVDVFVATPDAEAESAKSRDVLERETWRVPFASPAWPVDSEGRRDASPLSLLRLTENPDFAGQARAASTPEPLHPEVTAPLLEAWAMTSLAEHPGRPTVGPWLRGWIEDEPQTRLVWRTLFPVREEDVDDKGARRTLLRNLRTFFALAAPHLSEALDVPTYQAVELLRKRIAAWSKGQGAGARAKQPVARGPTRTLLVVLDPRDEVEDAAFADEFANEDPKELFRRISGRTVVLDARLGGLDKDGLLDEKEDEAPVTLDAETDGAGDAWAKEAGFRVRKVSRKEAQDPDWPIEYRFGLASGDDEDTEELRVEVLRTSSATSGDAAISRVRQGLSEHHAWTASAARRIAKELGLAPEHENVLVAAAAIHDAGKAREMWQNAMRAPRDGRPYAKTTGGGDFRALMIDGATYRHEFGSVGDAEADTAICELDDASRDLALHLVAAHHGYARPVIAPLDPDSPPSLALERARIVAMRFHRVERLWGPWGLAWWEALLRAADWAASRAANERKGES
jgi:CRISPR-associated endonuclease/helicase Cas3